MADPIQLGGVFLRKRGSQGSVDLGKIKQGGVLRDNLKSDEARALFDAFDLNKDGFLTAEEAEKLLNGLGNAADDGEITHNEARKFAEGTSNETMKKMNKDQILKAFNDLGITAKDITSVV